MKGEYYLYVITNKYNSVLYIGITNNLSKRIFEHKQKLIQGFSQKYNLYKLIYYETYPTPIDAIKREEQLKNWHRQWKINLIKKTNPGLKEIKI